MGHTSANEQVIVGHKVPSSQLDCVNSVSEVFSNTRYTANMSSSLKAMAVPSCMVNNDSLQTHGDVALSELEQQLLQEERKARECIDEIQVLWKDVVSQQMYMQL